MKRRPVPVALPVFGPWADGIFLGTVDSLDPPGTMPDPTDLWLLIEDNKEPRIGIRWKVVYSDEHAQMSEYVANLKGINRTSNGGWYGWYKAIDIAEERGLIERAKEKVLS